MKRRFFLKMSTFTGLTLSFSVATPLAYKKKLQAHQDIIRAVQEHMFPAKSVLPSAKAMDMTTFLLNTISHTNYDKDIRRFVIEGAEEFQNRTNNTFVSMSNTEKEKALRAYEQTSYGSSWLSRIMTLSIEGLLCDPVYGGNKNEKGWKALNSFGGFPRPKTKYISMEY